MQKTLTELTSIVAGRWIEGELDTCLQMDGVSIDTRSMRENQLYIPLVGERFDGHNFVRIAAEKGACAALWQEDHPVPTELPLPLIIVPDVLQSLQRLASYWRREVGAKVVAVTGSNGKTTTKELIGSILSQQYRVHQTAGNYNNHIGLPLTLLTMPWDTEVVVLEMGMNHAGEIALLSQIGEPDIAVITNIGDAHLEFFGSRAGIADAKWEITEGLQKKGILIINGDEPLLRERRAQEKRRCITIGWKEENDDRLEDFIPEGTTGISFLSSLTRSRFQIPLMGRYNALNGMLAIAVGRQLGVREDQIQTGLSSVQLKGMRLEKTTAPNGLLVINDAYNASPTSVRATIDLLVSLNERKEKWLLLGDILELGAEEERYHREIGRYAVAQGISRIYTVGARGRWIQEGALLENSHYPAFHFGEPREAGRRVRAEGHKNAVLLVKASRYLRLETAVQEVVKGESSI